MSHWLEFGDVATPFTASAILGGTSEPAEGVSIAIQTQDLCWVQDLWFAILDTSEASHETFLASGKTLKPYQDLWAGCCMLPDASPDVVHAMMLRFALAGELLVIICAQCRAPLYETGRHAGLRLYASANQAVADHCAPHAWQ